MKTMILFIEYLQIKYRIHKCLVFGATFIVILDDICQYLQMISEQHQKHYCSEEEVPNPDYLHKYLFT